MKPAQWKHLLCLVVLAGFLSRVLPAEESVESAALMSGRSIGDRVPQFYVRVVTGPLSNKSVCYVCRHGDRPVAMVFLREISDGVPEFLTALDRQLDQHRAEGLKGFCVLLSDSPRQATSQLQTLAFDNKLSIPLAWTSDQVATPANQNLHREAVVTVVLYRDQQVVESYAFRRNELTETRRTDVLAAVGRLIDGR